MATQLDLGRLVARLEDDSLYSIFADADAEGDRDLARAASAEITRRAELPAPTIHEVPAWLARVLPRQFWHQRPLDRGGAGD